MWGSMLEEYCLKHIDENKEDSFFFTFHNTASAQIFYDITVRLQIPSAYVDGWRSMVRCCWIHPVFPPRWDAEKKWWRNVTYSETTMTLSLLEQCLYVHQYILHIYIYIYVNIINLFSSFLLPPLFSIFHPSSCFCFSLTARSFTSTDMPRSSATYILSTRRLKNVGTGEGCSRLSFCGWLPKIFTVKKTEN